MKKSGKRDKLVRDEASPRGGDLDYRIIFDAASNGMAFTEADSGKIVDVNAAWLAATGFVREKVIGKTALEMGLWTDPVKRAASLAELEAQGVLADFESNLSLKSVETPHLVSARFVEMDGKRYVLWEFRNIARQKQSEEKIQTLLSRSEQSRRSLLGMLQDVKRAEEARRKSEERFRQLFDSAADALYVHDQQGRIVDVNQIACDTTGYRRDELLHMSVSDLEVMLPSADLAPLWARICSGQSATVEGVHRRRDGSTFPVEIHIAPFASGEQPLFFAAARDITERKQAETELRLIQTGLNQVGVSIFRVSPDTKIISVNDEACRSLGYTREELCRKSILEIDATFDPKKWEAHRRELKVHGTRTFEGTHRRKDGTIFPVEVTVCYLETEGEEHTISFARDITERRKALDQFQRLANEQRTILHTASMGICFVRNRKLEWVNPAFIAMSGYEPPELQGADTALIYARPEDYQTIGRECYAQFAKGAIYRNEMQMRRKDGSRLWCEIAGQAINSQNLDEGSIWSLLDITERKRAEAALEESEERLRTLVQTIPDLVWLKDVKGVFLFCNSAFERLFGTPKSSIIGKTDYDFVEKSLADAFRQRDQAAMAAGGPTINEEWLTFAQDGYRGLFQTVKTPMCGADGALVGILGVARDITEHKRTEETLGESRQMLQTVLNTVPARVFWKDTEGRYLGCNEPFARDAGFDSPEKLIGKDDYAMGWKAQADLYRADDRQVITSGVPKLNYEEPQTTPAGKQMWLRTSKIPLRDLEGRIIGILGTYEDITERKRAEIALRDSEDNFTRAQTLAHVGHWSRDLITNMVQWSDETFRIFGLTPQAGPVDAKIFYEAIHPDDRGRVNRSVADALAGVKTHDVVYRFVRPDGTIRFLHTVGEVSRDESGKPRRMFGSVADITERKRAEEALRESEEKHRVLIETTATGFVIVDEKGCVLDANDEYVRLSGHEKQEQILGRSVIEWTAAHDQARNAGEVRKCVANGLVRGLVMDYVHSDGTVVPVEINASTLRMGDRLRIMALCRNITERKQAEDRIREQAALLDAASDAIYVRALDHTVIYWNDGAERLYGLTRAEALGRKLAELGDLGHEAFATAHATLLEQGSWSGELKRINKAGKEIIIFSRWTLLRDEQNQPKEVLAINTDITEQKQLETNFLRAQRMEGIGALAGGIAHDLNNILQPILMTAPLLRETTSDPESREMLDTVENCAQRGANIIKQLLTFARGEPSARVPLPVRHLLNEMDKLIQGTFPKNIQLRVSVPKNLWQVLGDATQIHQALMNLCVNARDAMPNGGTLTLAAENLTLDEAFAAMMPNAKPGPYICVSVADTGTGIPPEHLDRIFDPFFTTKEIGKGTGLGLATVLGIARGHGGFVRVNSQVGKGTTFELYLPASLETKAAAPPAQETLPPRAGGELILVVDDEASVRGVVGRALEKHGYRVMPAAEGVEAMSLFARHRAEIRAVLTDMMMPVMDGPSLVRALRHLEPQLPILGMTGVGEKADIKGLEALNLLVLLTKPFNSVALLGVLHQALAAPSKAKGKP